MKEVTKVFFTEEEKVEWLKANGFNIIYRQYTEWVRTGHGSGPGQELVTTKAAIEVDGLTYRVEDVFERFFEEHYKKMFTPVNLETQRKIERILKSIKNGK